MKKQLIPCKIGTQPWLVTVRGNKTPKVGEVLMVKKDGVGKLHKVSVDQVNPDGRFFASLL